MVGSISGKSHPSHGCFGSSILPPTTGKVPESRNKVQFLAVPVIREAKPGGSLSHLSTIGCWYNGITSDSKPLDVGSIPTRPANIVPLRECRLVSTKHDVVGSTPTGTAMGQMRVVLQSRCKRDASAMSVRFAPGPHNVGMM